MTDNPHLVATVRELEKHTFQQVDGGERVLSQGDTSPHLGFLDEGILKGIVHPRFGSIRESVLSIVGDRHWFGLECIHGGHNIEYVALTSCRYWLVPLPWLADEAPPEVVRGILHDASWELARYFPVNYINKLSLKQRVLSKLCDIREACALPEIQITHEDLASLVGVHRNKIGVVLKELEREQLVECGYREILLGSRESLLRAFQESHSEKP